MKRYLAVIVLFIACSLGFAQTGDSPAPNNQPGTSQDQQRPGRGEFGMRQGQGVGGTIEEIKPDGFTLKTNQGNTVTVKVTGDTRFRKDRQPAKLADFKPGDMVMVGGDPAGEGSWTARFVISRQSMDEGRMQALREGLGKQFIAGEVKAIEGTKLTIARPDGQTQTIEVDENTSFRKGRESITFPEIKVGDRVFGRGALNSASVFVPSVLNVGGGGFGMGMADGERRRSESNQPPSKAAPPK